MIYVGQTMKSEQDSIKYIGSGKLLVIAVKEFGIKNFKKEILQVVESKEELNTAEIFWIKELNALHPSIGYNIHPGGSSCNRSRVIACIKRTLATPDQKARMSRVNKALWEKEDYREKVTDSNKKAWSNQEKKEEHSRRMKQVYANPNNIEKIKEASSRMPVVKCPHCEKEGKLNLMKAKHFDNCVFHTDEKMREIAIENRKHINEKTIKITCPYCDKSGVVGNMHRWHFENCKHKPQ